MKDIIILQFSSVPTQAVGNGRIKKNKEVLKNLKKGEPIERIN